MEYQEFTAKTVNDAITDACQAFGVPSDLLDYTVVQEESSGFLGLGSKPAIIRAAVADQSKKESAPAPAEEKKEEAPVKSETKVEEKAPAKAVSDTEIVDAATRFLSDVFNAMDMEVIIDVEFDQSENTMNINLSGEEMGVLIGKRGATLDSLQYLVSLVVNKDVEDYIRVKVDTENYRERRKETLENLAKNVASKVKRTGKTYELEPMNPYERRIIHSALQDSKYVTTYSKGEEPNRRVYVELKEGVRPTGDYNRGGRRRY
ncbi:MAG: protein jag [Lachnospiraceae bacterium]|nr:protein jag [Lachnospiraceae bacterium]